MTVNNMTTFIFLFLIAILFYILGRKDEIKRCNKELTNLLSTISELKSEIIVQKEINK